jgi:hypothetical protein
MDGRVETFTASIFMKVFLGQMPYLRIPVSNFMNIQRIYIVHSCITDGS